MSVDVQTLTTKMIAAGRGLAGGIWKQMEHYAGPEFKKIAVQIEALAAPGNPWGPAERTILLRMQVRAAITVIVAMTALTLQLVQDAINAVLAAVKDFVNGAAGIALL